MTEFDPVKMELSEKDVDNCVKMARTLQGSFVWGHSKQGHRYWQEVMENLEEMPEIYARAKVEGEES